MNSYKILLVSPSYTNGKNAGFFPLGMASISAVLKQAGYLVDCINFNNWHEKERLTLLTNTLENCKYDAIGIGGLSAAIRQVESYIAVVRAYSYGSKIILGGGLISADPEAIYSHLNPDVGVIGEGELTMLELVGALKDGKTDLSTIKGIIYKNGLDVTRTPERSSIKDLTVLPKPDLEGFGIQDYLAIQSVDQYGYHLTLNDVGPALPIAASRSCPYSCTFCFHPTGKVYRKLEIPDVVDYIFELRNKYNVRHFDIYDELFDAHKDRIETFCNQLIAKKANIQWTCQIRVKKVDLTLLKLMKRAGCRLLSYGFESGSNQILGSMKKKIAVTDIGRAAEITRAAGISIQANFLFGDPAETLSSVMETLTFQREHRLEFIDWSAVIAYPGTELYEQAINQGRIKDRIEYTYQVADGETYLWSNAQPRTNLTNLSDEKAQNLYLFLREATDAHHRRRLAQVISINYMGSSLYTAELQCPSCAVKSNYRMAYPPESAGKEMDCYLPYFAVRGLNTVCASCGRKMHIPSWSFPVIKQHFTDFQNRLDRLVVDGNSVVLIGAMDRYLGTFSSQIYFDLLPVERVMDTRQYRIGHRFRGIRVEECKVDALKRLHESNIVVFPNYQPRTINLLLENANIESSHVINWHCNLNEII